MVMTKEQFEEELKKEQLSITTFYEMYLDNKSPEKELINFNNFQEAFNIYFQFSELKNNIVEKTVKHFKQKFNII
jgi:hypothetical protein